MWQLLIPAITGVLDKVLPDPQAKAEAQLKMLEMAQKGELAALDADMKLALGQLEVNKVEAGTDDKFTRRWRPSIGYVLCAALAFQFLINPLIVWYAAIWQPGIVPPSIGLDDNLWELMFGILGMAGWRSLDKMKVKKQ
jgi:hypothetical protein